MAVTTDAPRVSRKGLPALLAAFSVLLSVFALTSPAARAEDGRSTAAGGRAVAWTPGVSPLYPGNGESVFRNVSTDVRNSLLNNCQSGFACIAAGQGDGNHSVFKLYRCTQRTLSNFLGAGAVNNKQTDDAVVRLLKQNKDPYMSIWGTSDPIRVPDWGPVWYIVVC